MKKHHWILGGSAVLAVAILVIWWIVTHKSDPPVAKTQQTVIVAIDCSGSTESERHTFDQLLCKLLVYLPMDTRVIICRFSRNCMKLAEYEQAPDLEQLSRSGVSDGLKLQTDWGTRPLTVLQYFIDYAEVHGNQKCSLVLLSDGENSFLTDDLSSACRKASEIDNVERIGLFGLASSNRAIWDRLTLPLGDRAIVRGTTDSNESISSFARRIHLDRREFE